MEIIISTALILAITFVAWLFNKVAPFRVCPVCAGVSGTWFLLTGAILRGFVSGAEYGPIVALLMGGTVVGVAYQGEKVCSWAEQHALSWKILVVGIGPPVAYLLFLSMSWTNLIIEFATLVVLLYFLFIEPSARVRSQISSAKEQAAVERLTRKLDECC